MHSMPCRQHLPRYTEDQMTRAFESVKNGMSKKAAAKRFNVPKSTLSNKVSGRTPLKRILGRRPLLSMAEETSVADWIGHCERRGGPTKLNEVLDTVQAIVQEDKRVTPIKDGRPGRAWFKAFCERHPSVPAVTHKGVSSNPAPNHELELRKWFSDLKNNITDMNAMDALENPDRVFNLDQTNIKFQPYAGRGTSIHESKNVYVVAPGLHTSTVTSVVTFSASGCIVAPTVIFPYLRLPQDIVEQVPDDFIIGLSESGLMRSKKFYEYIGNAFLPWIDKNKIQKPVILFVDGHLSLLTLQVSTLCENNGIILYLLPPYMTLILQPAAVGSFNSLKQYWMEEIKKYQIDNDKLVKHVDVALLMKRVLMQITSSSIKNGFQSTGLYPLNSDSLDYTKYLELHEPVAPGNFTQKHLSQHVSPSTMLQAEKYRCALQIIEAELGKKNLVTLQDELAILPENSLHHIYQSIKGKAMIVNVEINSDIQTLTSLQLENEINESSSESSYKCFQKIEKEACSCHTNCLFLEGKNNNKKYKVSTTQEKLLTSSTSKAYRATKVDHVTGSIVASKSSEEDWICIYCLRSYSSNSKTQWIYCDGCAGKMHLYCIPRNHMQKLGVDLADLFTDDDPFFCDTCHHDS